MSMIMAIDGFRLLAEPLASIAVYLSEVVRSLHVLPEVKKLYLILPRKPNDDFIHNKLVELKNVEFIYPINECFPERSFFSEIYWTHVIIPHIIRTSIKSINYYFAPYHHPPIFLRKGIYVITIIHDLCGLRADCGYSKTGRGFYQHLFRFLAAAIRSDRFVPISHYTKSQFSKRFPFLVHKISNVVYNGVSCQPVSDTIFRETLHKYNLRSKSYFLGFGSPSMRKGIDLMLDSYKAYKESGGSSSLLLIAAKYYQDAVLQMVHRERLRDVLVISDVGTSERDSFYRGAVALVFPSRCEGFGYPVLEAMRQGCPPIVFREGPMAEIVDSAFPLLEQLAVKQIVSQMVTFEKLDSDARARLREGLIRRSLVFTGDTIGNNLLRAIKEAM